MPGTPTTSAKKSGISRREFCGGAVCTCSATSLFLAEGGLIGAARLAAQVKTSPAGTATRPDVAAIDHDRILASAQRYLTQTPTALTSLQCPRSAGTVHDYYSEANISDGPTQNAKKPTSPPPFTEHRDALFNLALAVPALAAAHLLTGEDRYAQQAAVWLRAWFIDPDTRMTPKLDYAQVMSRSEDRPELPTKPEPEAPPVASVGGRPEGILETLPLVEVAQAIPFLLSSKALDDADRAALTEWFAAYLGWLTEPQDSGPRLAALARDRKDHHGSSWLLQTSAYATLTTPEGTAPKSETSALEKLRHRFRTVTLRAQIAANGSFPHELTSATPYRDSLFNLDILAAVCLLLSTRFESVWDYELEDGPGMRSAIAYHFPFISNRTLWPFRSDATHFNELPGRRASLLFTARAYQRPEYAALWKTLPPDSGSLDILRTMPIHQPILWVRQPPRA